MAKLIQNTLVIQVSKMVRDSEPSAPLIDPDIVAQLEAVIAELAGGEVMVEITSDEL